MMLSDEIRAAQERAAKLQAQRTAARLLAARYNGSLRAWALDVEACDIALERPLLYRLTTERAA